MLLSSLTTFAAVFFVTKGYYCNSDWVPLHAQNLRCWHSWKMIPVKWVIQIPGEELRLALRFRFPSLTKLFFKKSNTAHWELQPAIVILKVRLWLVIFRALHYRYQCGAAINKVGNDPYSLFLFFKAWYRWGDLLNALKYSCDLHLCNVNHFRFLWTALVCILVSGTTILALANDALLFE